MKGRDYKEFAKGSIYHIYNRGNNREKIFLDGQDYKCFLYRLSLTLGFKEKDLKHELLSVPHSRIRIVEIGKDSFKIHVFSLMPNHFHLLIEQCKEIPISKLMSKLSTSYSSYVNKKYKRVGHVFQDQFKAVLIENDKQLMWVSAYIHMNAVKDKLIKHPQDYIWSSYNDYANNRNLPIVHKELLLKTFGDKEGFIKETLNFDVKDDPWLN